MGRRIVREPEDDPVGSQLRFAVFSDIVDDFTVLRMTLGDAVDYCIEDEGMGELDALDKVRRAVVDEPPHLSTPGYPPPDSWDGSDGLGRWRQCMEQRKAVHGREDWPPEIVLPEHSAYALTERQKHELCATCGHVRYAHAILGNGGVRGRLLRAV